MMFLNMVSVMSGIGIKIRRFIRANLW